MKLGRRSLVLSLCLLIAHSALDPSRAWSCGRTFGLKRIISNATSGGGNFLSPTVVTINPADGKLYIAQQDGRIFKATINANVTVSSVTEIDTIYQWTPGCTPVAPGTGRLVTGMTFGPGGDLFVSHSDVRIYDHNISTTSGAISRLYASSGFTTCTDLVTGLPRSKADHAPNGLAFAP